MSPAGGGADSWAAIIDLSSVRPRCHRRDTEKTHDRAKTRGHPKIRPQTGDAHGPEFHARRTSFPRGDTRLGGCEPAQGHQPQGAQRAAPVEGRPAALGPHPGRQGLARLGLAEAVRRPGLDRDPEAPVRRGMRPRRRAARDPVRPGDGRPGDHGLRHARAAAALPARHHERQGLVEPGLQRTGLGLGPGLGQDQGRTQGRLLPGQRPEDLDHARPVRRLDLLPGAHQQRRQAADRHQLPADRHEEPRRLGAPHHHDGRRARGQRGLVRQRRGPGRPVESARRTRAGPTPSTCWRTSAPTSPTSTAPSANSNA